MAADYRAFIEAKTHEGADHGFAPTFMPDVLIDFQQALTEWAVRKGRAAIFADCGLGKTPMQLVWAENVARHAGKPVLILAPLAVAAQTVREAENFGVEYRRSSDGKALGRITITNYERLERFTPSDFAGVACDESSILKSFDGAIRNEITSFMRKVPYRLLATATAAPNDYLELGTSSEALGHLGHMDMLSRFFKNGDNSSVGTRRMYGEAPKWEFKGHSQQPFWRWVTSWARACRKPSDLGFEDGRFVLPPLTETQHVVAAEAPTGSMFAVPRRSLPEQRAERKRTVRERCEKVAELVGATGKPALVWCHLNEEGDLLEETIPGAVQVSGSDSDEAKEERFLAFSSGEARVLVTKPKIGAWGLNFQHCAHVTFFPTHSFEQFYQGVRRCWRFGQTSPVQVDLVLTPGERLVMDNLTRKAEAASRMFSALVAEMNNPAAIAKPKRKASKLEVPGWL